MINRFNFESEFQCCKFTVSIKYGERHFKPLWIPYILIMLKCIDIIFLELSQNVLSVLIYWYFFLLIFPTLLHFVGEG